MRLCAKDSYAYVSRCVCVYRRGTVNVGMRDCVYEGNMRRYVQEIHVEERSPETKDLVLK